MMGYFIRTTLLPDRWSSKKQKIVSIVMSVCTFFLFWLIPKLLFTHTLLGVFGHPLAIIMGTFTLLLSWPQAVKPEMRNPVNRFLIWVYRPIILWVLRHKAITIMAAFLIAMTLLPFRSQVVDKLPDGLLRSAAEKIDFLFPFEKIGGEFMPPLYEGDFLYMPTTLPGISISKARELLQQTDKIIKTFPEVDQVFGKIGRADTATDPAPLSMIETTITLKPDNEWRKVPVKRFFSDWPEIIRRLFSKIWPEERRITLDNADKDEDRYACNRDKDAGGYKDHGG
jgi:Cu(I)/Ag(I) efflux system membrane protein CusA/SilA